MMTRALADRAQDLRARGEPFVTATVVRVRRPTSAQTGNVALVRRDGTIEGFVGGVSAQHTVRLYSLKAIQTGEPVLLRITPDGPEAPAEDELVVPQAPADDEPPLSGQEIGREEGTVTVHNPCLSGGTLELFLEPELPAPRVLVAGDSPIVGAVKALGEVLGIDVVAAVDRVDGKVTPHPGDLALIVAAHGHDEVPVLRAGLEAAIPYIGLVASPKRGAAVLDDLRAEGVGEDELARIDSPAGLDIGARTAAEIALSILAEVVAVRRRHADQPGPANASLALEVHAHAGSPDDMDVDDASLVTAAEMPPIAVDPICGMTVVVVPGTPWVRTGDEVVYFCCESCKLVFERQHQPA